MMIDKTEILSHLRAHLNQKLNRLNKLIDDKRASNTDTKSSMGDKYETAREMLNQEVNQLLQQQRLILEQQELLQLFQSKTSTKVEQGTIVFTSFQPLIVGIGLGAVDILGQSYFCISLESPLAQHLIGLQVGDHFQINQVQHQILAVY